MSRQSINGNKLPKNFAELTIGSFGYQRALAAGSTPVGEGILLAAVEANKYNGPWDVPDNVRKLNGVLRYSQGTATDGLSITFTSSPLDPKIKDRYRDPPDAQSRLSRGFAQDRCGGKLEVKEDEGKTALVITLKAKI